MTANWLKNNSKLFEAVHSFFTAILKCRHSHFSHLLGGTLRLPHHRPSPGVLDPAHQAQAETLPLCILQGDKIR